MIAVIVIGAQLLALLLWIPLGHAAKRGDAHAVPPPRDP